MCEKAQFVNKLTLLAAWDWPLKVSFKSSFEKQLKRESSPLKKRAFCPLSLLLEKSCLTARCTGPYFFPFWICSPGMSSASPKISAHKLLYIFLSVLSFCALYEAHRSHLQVIIEACFFVRQVQHIDYRQDVGLLCLEKELCLMPPTIFHLKKRWRS